MNHEKIFLFGAGKTQQLLTHFLSLMACCCDFSFFLFWLALRPKKATITKKATFMALENDSLIFTGMF
jgi:hypothetical protein